MTFVDTSALLAFLARDDRYHGAAVDAFGALIEAGLVTHEYVVVEVTALAQRRLGMGAVRSFVDDLLPAIEVVWVDEALHVEAREAMLAAGQRTVSLVDWTSFLVMRRHGIGQAFTFDVDFAAHGFEVVPAA